MSIYVGGLRKRLVRDSVFVYVHDRLDDLGWFDPGRQHLPIDFVDVPQEVTEAIALNTLALATEDNRQTEMELGGQLTEFRWQMYLDFFAENDSIATHLIGDIADILGGRMSSIGADRSVIPVMDFTLASPVELFAVQVETVNTDKAHNWPHAWLKHWQSCSFEVVDEYGDESG